jgi:hypothetical protein
VPQVTDLLAQLVLEAQQVQQASDLQVPQVTDLLAQLVLEAQQVQQGLLGQLVLLELREFLATLELQVLLELLESRGLLDLVEFPAKKEQLVKRGLQEAGPQVLQVLQVPQDLED